MVLPHLGPSPSKRKSACPWRVTMMGISCCIKITNNSYWQRHTSRVNICVYCPLPAFGGGRMGLVGWRVVRFGMVDNIITTMMRHRKVHMIRKYAHGLRVRKLWQLYGSEAEKDEQQIDEGQGSHEGEGIEVEEQESEEEMEEEEQEEDGGGFSVSDYISMLSKQDRQIFKKENPQLPPLFFMTNKEKKRYFEDVNRKFSKILEKIPQRSSSTMKILKFKNEFQVKPFCEKESVASIKQAKQFKQPYHHKIHFS